MDILSTRSRLFGLLLVVVGLYFAWTGYEKTKRLGRLRVEGVVVPGKVLDHEFLSEHRRATKYLLITQFLPNNRCPAVVREIQVGKTLFEATSDGEDVKVRHVSTDPTVVEIDGAGVAPRLPVVMELAGVGLCVSGVVCLPRTSTRTAVAQTS